MKVEMAESLMLSWLRHVKCCKLVQLNWKPSVSSWALYNEEIVATMMKNADQHFEREHNLDLFKKNSSYIQLLQQGEIDLLGLDIGMSGIQDVYAVDVAFHENGLNYGSKEETIARVLKKMFRTAMILHGYFNMTAGNIIFASPKIYGNILEPLVELVGELHSLCKGHGLVFQFSIICNEQFRDEVFNAVTAVSDSVADTSELFMRSIQMYSLLCKDSPKLVSRPRLQPPESEPVSAGEMKIGVFVRSTLIEMFANDEISPEEVALMQTDEYSKKTFDIQYPLLRKASLSNGQRILRYWAGAIDIYGEKYFICSEWFEVPQNNDRSYFMKWLGLRKKLN